MATFWVWLVAAVLPATLWLAAWKLLPTASFWKASQETSQPSVHRLRLMAPVAPKIPPAPAMAAPVLPAQAKKKAKYRPKRLSAGARRAEARRAEAKSQSKAKAQPKAKTQAQPSQRPKKAVSTGSKPPKAIEIPRSKVALTSVVARPRQACALNYPEEARLLELEGEVALDVLIDAQGKVAGATVVRAADPILAKAALSGVRQCSFLPAQHLGVPRASRIPYMYAFVLDDE